MAIISEVTEEKVTPLQAAKMMIWYGAVLAQDYPDGNMKGGEGNVLLPELTERERQQIQDHIWPQIDRLVKFFGIEELV